MPKERVPQTISLAIKTVDKGHFPNVHTLLKLAATLPITSCECERSFSGLRRLKTWLRNTMNTDRLAPLALMNVHYDHDVSYKRAADLFFQLYPRRLLDSNLVFQSTN